MKLPNAEDVNYWQTSQTDPDTWIEKTHKLILGFGGKIKSYAFGSDPASGSAAYLLVFEMQGDYFRIVWPVLPTRSGKLRAAKIQATTLMYHDVKARLLTLEIFGARHAFFQYLMLSDGRVASEIASQELLSGVPDFFKHAQLSAGSDIVEGSFEHR